MIYLIKTSMLVVNDESDMDKDEVIPILKIGYSEDSRGNGRFNDYTSNGLVIRVIKTIPGGSWNLEHTLQRYFQKYKLPGKSIEWFYYSDEIVNFFINCTDAVDIYNLFDVNNEDELVKKQLESRSEAYRLICELNDGYSRFIEDHPDELVITSIFNKIVNCTILFSERMKIICTCNLDTDGFNLLLEYLPKLFVDFYITLGPERIKALEYRREYLNREMYNIKKVFDIDTINAITESFIIGKRYSRSEIKSELSKIYSKLNISLTPKATDLLKYFELKDIDVPRADDPKKRDKGFLIIGLKENI